MQTLSFSLSFLLYLVVVAIFLGCGELPFVSAAWEIFFFFISLVNAGGFSLIFLVAEDNCSFLASEVDFSFAIDVFEVLLVDFVDTCLGEFSAAAVDGLSVTAFGTVNAICSECNFGSCFASPLLDFYE